MREETRGVAARLRVLPSSSRSPYRHPNCHPSPSPSLSPSQPRPAHPSPHRTSTRISHSPRPARPLASARPPYPYLQPRHRLPRTWQNPGLLSRTGIREVLYAFMGAPMDPMSVHGGGGGSDCDLRERCADTGVFASLLALIACTKHYLRHRG